ncbi:hypothetical protein KL918_003590 [Ogataea parapolymorpha]|uniref:Allantoate permease n=2 Tax=Ogataea parapolymorpha TaxID=1005962 RepID=W1Q701_OGAPD|nr:hypothetical protein HPODL_02669 [Ogataea parapolymorpha DL-1]AOY08553.1 Soa1-like protein [Ogataea parapolymorpha]ESW96028.1 hypothetical protein HPODL_02669 [Ogataea parapolymorpha DL-1]KAG7866693.1 hypothetical protein KL918_003590 [Ogataea parapolymorpha]KAG7870621.1 hypothetical protein KL916_004826 [Ogataea parapolymorpha]
MELDSQNSKGGETVSVSKRRGSSLSNTTNPFLDPFVASYWTKVYRDCRYECRERFDPLFSWTLEEERDLGHKLDMKVTALACFMFVALQVDRGNLAQAVADNLLQDLGLTTDMYNNGNTIFFVAFIVSEVPSSLICKKLGVDRWVPFLMVSWSLVAILQCKMTNRHSFYATRALLGLLEGGFTPELVLWMSYFFTSSELSIKLSYFWTALSLTQIGTALMAYGILRMRGILGMAGWQWLFIIEGAFTLLIALVSALVMAPSVVQTKRFWNKKGWFTEREEKIIVNKVLRDDPSKGDMNNRQGVTTSNLIYALLDYNMYPLYIIGILAYIPLNLLTSYMTLVLKNLGFTTLNAVLLTVPYSFIHIILLIAITWLSEKVNERSLVCCLFALYEIPLVGVLAFWKDSMVNKWGTWAVCTLILGLPYIHAICLSWVSRNSRSLKTRSVSTSLYYMCAQIGSLISANIYHESDAPLYRKGNTILFWLSVAMLPVLLLTKAYYMYVNHLRERQWQMMDPAERENYILNTTDVGSKRLDFRLAH